MNLSGVSMGEPTLLAFIEQRLHESPAVDPSQLTFEVTETSAVANLAEAREFANRLMTLGCSFSLDDFGAGFDSFYHLEYLAFTDLEIDGELITQCLSNPTDQLVSQAVVMLGQGLGRSTIAEYVGDQDTLELLGASGVGDAQGFHVGRPEAIEAAMRRLVHGLGGQQLLRRGVRPAGYEDDVRAVQQLWRDGDRDAARRHVPTPIGLGTNLIGTDDLVRERLRPYQQAGVTTLRAQLQGDPSRDLAR